MEPPNERAMRALRTEEFCAKPPRFAVGALYAFMVQGFACAALASLVLIAAAIALAMGALAVDWWRLLLIAVGGAVGLLTGRASRRAIRGAKDLSLTVDAGTLYVTDLRGTRRAVDLADIEQLKASHAPAGRYLWFTTRVVVVTRSGEQIALPLRIRDPAALVDRVRRVAGLENHRYDEAWDTYSRPGPYEGRSQRNGRDPNL